MRLKPTDVKRVVLALPPDLKAVLTNAKGRLFLCGGFIRDTVMDGKPKDADIFGQSADEVKAAGLTQGGMWGVRRKTKPKPTVYSITWSEGWTDYDDDGDGEADRAESEVPVQFIYTWPVSNAWTAIKRMDFTMCQAAIWYSRGKWRSVCTKDFYPDVKDRRLRYTWPEREGTAGRSLVRATNFVARGWWFPADEIAALVAHTSHEVNTPDVRMTPTRRKKACYKFSRNVSGLYPIGAGS